MSSVFAGGGRPRRLLPEDRHQAANARFRNRWRLESVRCHVLGAHAHSEKKGTREFALSTV